jgi:hypothetical protein
LVEIDGAKNRGRAFCNCLQNFIASVQVTLSRLPFGDSADEISGQAPLYDLAAALVQTAGSGPAMMSAELPEGWAWAS